MGEERYDVTIVGAGPAGATAAIRLAQQGRRTLLVDGGESTRPALRAAWLSAHCTSLLSDLGIDGKPLLECPVSDVTFHRADFSQTAKPAFVGVAGYLIDRARFDATLTEKAEASGAELARGHPVTDIQLRESSVVVHLADGRALESRLLLLAAGRQTDLLSRVGLVAGKGEPLVYSTQAEAPLPPGAAPARPRTSVILGLDDTGGFGICTESQEWIAVGVNWAGEADRVIPTLVHVCRQAFEHGIAAIDLSETARAAEVHRVPQSAALDMESHVGKHTLVIGDAGGFTAAASHEGIYPAMWSATIAVDVVISALQSVHSQDELMTFDSIWRMKMADYLRSPHTDIQFLIPLVFTNQPMADRMGAAFFLGENI
jgi:flavin-dependent dehydrogenase